MSEMGRQGRGRGERGDELVPCVIIYVLATIPLYSLACGGSGRG